ncbi:MAG: hypothetical protein HOL68_12165 [Bacteroidetes Order II. Incertae sedis bacterium]|nr:hypothetical protein [Bacteroidetes Order II. bacterium]
MAEAYINSGSGEYPLIHLSKLAHTPEDIRLWLLAADPDTGELERDLPLPVAHDAVKLGLAISVDGGWVMTASGRDVRNEMLND